MFLNEIFISPHIRNSVQFSAIRTYANLNFLLLIGSPLYQSPLSLPLGFINTSTIVRGLIITNLFAFAHEGEFNNC